MDQGKPSPNECNSQDDAQSGGREFLRPHEEVGEGEGLGKHASDENKADPKPKAKSWIVQFFSETTATDWAITFLTFGMLVVGYWQWQAINGQLQEMKASGKQTDELIDLYGQQLGELRKQVTDTHDLAIAANTQAEAAKRMAGVAQRTFSAARPFLYITAVRLIPNQDKSAWFEVIMANGSDIPVSNFIGDCDIFVDGKAMEERALPSKSISFGGHATPKLCSGSAPNEILDKRDLVIYAHGTYDGPAGHYNFCDKEQYSKDAGQFFDLGTCDPAKPFPQ